MAFTGTLDKCKACDKTVYVVDLLTLEGNPYHKNCFKCSHCKGTLSVRSVQSLLIYFNLKSNYLNLADFIPIVCLWQMSSYSWMDGVLYCKTHFEQLFKESGNFSKNFQSSSTTFLFLFLPFYFSLFSDILSFPWFCMTTAKSSDKPNDLV